MDELGGLNNSMMTIIWDIKLNTNKEKTNAIKEVQDRAKLNFTSQNDFKNLKAILTWVLGIVTAVITAWMIWLFELIKWK